MPTPLPPIFRLTAALCLACVAICSPVLAADPPAVDDDLPQPLGAQDMQDLLAHSPFVRSLDLEDSLQLTGVAYMNGRPVATVYDRETRASIVISEEPNAQGWRLKGVNQSTNLQGTHVTVMIGTEEVSLAYGNEQLTPGSGKKGMPTAHAPVGEPGQGRGMAGGPSGSGNGPGGEQRMKASSYLGENGREMYGALSDKGRDKFKELIRARIEQKPDLTQAQREAYAKKVYSSIKEQDTKGGAAAAAPAAPKVKKTEKRAK